MDYKKKELWNSGSLKTTQSHSAKLMLASQHSQFDIYFGEKLGRNNLNSPHTDRVKWVPLQGREW